MDEFAEIDFLLYAVKDSALVERSFAEVAAQELQPLMQAWFKALGKIGWLKRLAALGDDVLLLWGNGDVLQGPFADTSALMAEFMQHQQIFSFLPFCSFHVHYHTYHSIFHNTSYNNDHNNRCCSASPC